VKYVSTSSLRYTEYLSLNYAKSVIFPYLFMLSVSVKRLPSLKVNNTNEFGSREVAPGKVRKVGKVSLGIIIIIIIFII